MPEDVRLETHIRAKSIEGVRSATKKVDRALKSGAFGMGASVTITTTPGYLPVQNDPGLQRINTANLMQLAGEDAVPERGHAGWRSDTGDLATLIPVAFSMVASASASTQARDYPVLDYPHTLVSMAKANAETVIDLLSDGAEHASLVEE